MSRFQCPICLYPFQTEAEREAHVPCPSNGTENDPEPWDEDEDLGEVPVYAGKIDVPDGPAE